jgi:hypothetical protein
VRIHRTREQRKADGRSDTGAEQRGWQHGMIGSHGDRPRDNRTSTTDSGLVPAVSRDS